MAFGADPTKSALASRAGCTMFYRLEKRTTFLSRSRRRLVHHDALAAFEVNTPQSTSCWLYNRPDASMRIALMHL